MMLQKTLDYGFFGYQATRIPRATRSARRRSSFRKQIDDNPLSAFDLLATVAGNLLLEEEGLPSSSDTLVKKEPHSNDTRSKINLEKVPNGFKIITQCPTSSKDFPHVYDEDHSGPVSVVTSSDCSEKMEDLKSVKKRIILDYALDGENKDCMKVEAPKTENTSISTTLDMHSLDIRAISDVKLPLCNEQITSDFVPIGGRDDVKLVIRDDDEKSSPSTKFGTGVKASRPSPRVGDRKIRKLLASKYWKVTPNSMETPHSKADSEIKPVYQCRKNCYKRQRSQRDYPLKKRRLYRCGSLSNPDSGINCDNVVSLPRKESSFDASDFGVKLNGGSGISTCVAGQPTPLQSRDTHVKLRIKSFKVPELFIDIPENATIGHLKRMVLEAVTTLFGDGLRVGVLLQGRKIKDENRTLLQSGISHEDVFDELGFSLEPNPSHAPLAFQHEDDPSLLPCGTPQQLKRYPTSPRAACSAVQSKKFDAFSDPPLLNFMESDHDSAPSPHDTSSPDKNPIDSRALVAAPVLDVEALSMVPSKKSKRIDSAQRRIRRPFSVTEVEALVQAVEKLGTGRWRDVKLRAFDNAKHRTYVDLKDKWKTLVHTARISPQQRRGEPVPQELLDRVLTAHAYWSQQQVKQQLKHHSETCLLL